MFYNSPGTYYPKAAAGVCQNMHTNAPLGFTAPPFTSGKLVMLGIHSSFGLVLKGWGRRGEAA